MIQVFNRLQKIQLCLSQKATLQFFDVAAEEYDEKVHRWKDSLVEKTANPGTLVNLILMSIVKTIYSVPL